MSRTTLAPIGFYIFKASFHFSKLHLKSNIKEKLWYAGARSITAINQAFFKFPRICNTLYYPKNIFNNNNNRAEKANIFVVLHSVIDVGRDITPSGNSCVQIVQWHRYKVHAYVRTTATSNCDANSFRFCFFLAKMLRVTNCRLQLGLKYPEGVGTEVTNGQRLASFAISTSWKSLAMCFCCPS